MNKGLGCSTCTDGATGPLWACERCNQSLAETEIGPRWLHAGLTERSLVFLGQHMKNSKCAGCAAPPIVCSSDVAAASLPTNDWAALMLSEPHETFLQDVVKNLHLNIWEHIGAKFNTRIAQCSHTYRAPVYMNHSWPYHYDNKLIVKSTNNWVFGGMSSERATKAYHQHQHPHIQQLQKQKRRPQVHIK